MTYIVNKTDGTVLTTIIDNTTDETTDLTLIGKNLTGFGEPLNENLVKLLENFASVSAPERPIEGQLWFDKTEERIKVFTRTGWKSSGGPIISDRQPLDLTAGDLWLDNNENQLYFYDGTDLILAGPTWKRTQGKSGFVAETVFDENGNSKTILSLYVSDFRLGIFVSEEFTPSPLIQGFTLLKKGFNSNSLITFTFNTTVSNSLALNGIESTQFLRSDINSTTIGQILIQNNNGLSVGTNQTGELKVQGTKFLVENSVVDGDIALRTNNVSGVNNAIYIDSSTNRIGFYTTTPQSTVDIDGDLRVRGNFVVDGDELIINAGSLKVEDKNIELATIANPTDTNADGAGVIIKGTTDKTIIYNNSNSTFDISESLDLAAGKSIKIGGVEILNGNTLSAAITNAPGITSFGPQTQITVGNLQLLTNRIETTVTNEDIVLSTQGTGNIIIEGDAQLKGIASPTDPTDAVNKEYAENYAKTLPLSVSVISNGIGSAINANIVLFLTDIANPVYFENGKIAFVHVQSLAINSGNINVTRTLKRFEIQSGVWQFVSNLTSSI